MVRWYDHFAAVMFADLIMNFAIAAYASIAVSILYTLLFAAMAAILYDLWINTYCKFRLVMEMKR
jgi:hypothetical protein